MQGQGKPMMVQRGGGRYNRGETARQQADAATAPFSAFQIFRSRKQPDHPGTTVAITHIT